MPVGITVWRVRIGMFNSVFLFVKAGRSISSELLKSALLLSIRCYRKMIISLFAIPLTLTIESLLVIAEATLFLFFGVKVGSHDPISVQLSLKSLLCMKENVGVHTIQLSQPVIS